MNRHEIHHHSDEDDDSHHHHHHDLWDPTKIFISHQGTFYNFWRALINNLCFVSAFSYAHFAAFKHSSENHYMAICGIEFIFLIDFMMTFFVDYKDQMKNHEHVIRDHEKIATRYIQNGSFKIDILALLPVQWLVLERNRQRYLYIFKLIRLKQGLDNMDINKVLRVYKSNQQSQLAEFIEQDLVAANCKITDHTRIGRILAMSFILKTLKVIIVIASCSYFFGMAFKILIEIEADLNNWDDYGNGNSDDQPEHFTSFYGLDCVTGEDMFQVLVYFYFSFTSLSTVGLGDYNPRSDNERLFIAFGLLVGVAIFSYIIGEFCKMVESYSTYNQLWGG